MGKCYSDKVEQALEYIYYNEKAGKGQEGFQLLEEASAAGDGDASCILARCLNGYQYVWRGHGFPEDEARATKLLHKSIEQGSALGVLIGMRNGDLTPSMEKKMPFASIQEAFDVVLRNAQQGDAFSQYVIGNTYFWWDFLRIQGKGAESFPNREAFKAYLKENIQQCEGWFLKAFQNGLFYAGNNLNSYYENGDEDIIPPQPQKAAPLHRMGAERGYPTYEYLYGLDLQKEKRYEDAIYWLKKAMEHGEPGAWYYVGSAYAEGEGVTKDEAYAAKCCEKSIELGYNLVGSHNQLGYLYYKGLGVPQDYAKAYQHLIWAYENDSQWGLVFLGECCFYGRGVQQDYKRAREFMEQVNWNSWSANYILGCIYGQGLGVPADIKKGVEYLQKAGDMKEAKEELLHYKKGFFGQWKRR